MKLTKEVVSLLQTQMWDLATCSDDKPNVVPVAFKDVDDEGRLQIGDVFLETTILNLARNEGRIAISVYNPTTFEGYQIQGVAQYFTGGPVVAKFKELVEKTFNGAATAKGALVVVPERVIVTTPGAENKTEL